MMMMIMVRPVHPNLSLITANHFTATLTNKMLYQMRLCQKIFSTSCLARKQGKSVCHTNGIQYHASHSATKYLVACIARKQKVYLSYNWNTI